MDLKDLIKTDAKVASCILAWLEESHVEIDGWELEDIFPSTSADPEKVLKHLYPELAELEFYDEERDNEYFYTWLKLGNDYYEFVTDHDSWSGHEFEIYDVTRVKKGTSMPKTIMVFEGR